MDGRAMKVCMVAPSVKFMEPLAQTIHQREFSHWLSEFGVDLDVLTRQSDDFRSSDFFGTNVRCHRVMSTELPLKRIPFTWHTRRVMRGLDRGREGGWDLIHDRGYLFGGSGTDFARRKGLPVLLQIDDDWVETEALSSPLAATGLYKQFALRWCAELLSKVDHAFTVSGTLKDIIVERWGADPERISVVPNGVDIDRFRPDASPHGIRDELGLGDAPLIIFVGALGPWHGVQNLLNAAPLVLKEHPSARFLIVGGAKEYSIDHLHERARELSVSDSVTFLGPMPSDKIPGLVVEADVAVAPYSNVDYGFSPLKIYEYMGAGRPIVASSLPSIFECVTDDEDALLVEPENEVDLAGALIRVIGDASLAERLGRKARENAVARFSWKACTRKLLDIYETLV